MNFDISWALIGLPIAFVAGWLASRADLRQLRMENRLAPKAYFKGLNHLLNEQQDQAIDAFIEAVQNDPDTSELHFALGNLFRRRGEYERAVRVHQHLLSRGDLKPADRDRAQHALALDYLKAGLLDRAEAALRLLEGTAFETQARLALLAIYERSRDWAQAADIAQRLQVSGQGSFDARLAHHLCEQASALSAAGQAAQAGDMLAQAQSLAPDAVRPAIDRARWLAARGLIEQAQTALLELIERLPAAVPMAAPLLSSLAKEHLSPAQGAEVLQHLVKAGREHPGLDVMEAVVTLQRHLGGSEQPSKCYEEHLAREPSLVAATRWLASERLVDAEHHPQVNRALDHACQPLLRYRCAACGFEARQHFWQCPGCQTWDSFPTRRIEEL